MKDLSIIIPAYNEEKRISQTLIDYYGFFKNKGNIEIIIVCDGCTDQTQLMISRLGIPMKALNYQYRLGKGLAIKRGFREASGKVICYTDADGATSAEEMTKLIAQINLGYDVAIGSRKMRDSILGLKQSAWRSFLSWGYVKLVHLIFRLPFNDLQCGAKAFTLQAAIASYSYVNTDSGLFDTDLLITLPKLGYRIQEVPIIWNNRREGSHADATLAVFWNLLKLKFRRNITWNQPLHKLAAEQSRLKR